MLLAFVYSWCTYECSGEETIIFECDSKEEAYLILADRVEEEFTESYPNCIFVGEIEVSFSYLLGTNMSDNKVDKDSVLQKISRSIVEVKDLAKRL
jgi:hypothetical protein